MPSEPQWLLFRVDVELSASVSASGFVDVVIVALVSLKLNDG